MISWIQRTFQQHFKWLFLGLLAVIIVSFVFITNTSSGLGQSAGPRVPDRPFFGLNLSKIDDQRALIGDAQLSLYLRRPAFEGEPSGAELEQYALQRRAALHLADQLGLPAPTAESPEVAAYIQSLGRFTGAEGNFDPKAYASFLDSLETNPRLTEADVARVILDDVRAQAYQSLLSGPGYVLPSDVREQLSARDTRWTLALASLDGQAFSPRIDVLDTAVQAWFETNSRRYEIGPRVSVAAIKLPASAHADSIALTEAEIRAAYDANPARYPSPDAKGQSPSADAAFPLVRGQVEADLRKQRAERAALAAADDLAVKLLEQRIGLAQLESFLAKKNLALEEVGLVGVGAIPASLGGVTTTAQVAPEALRLSAERPYSNPIPTPEGAAILVFRERIEPRVPEFAEVRSQVLADYQAAEKRRLFNEAGRKLRETVAAALGAGRPFADAVKSAAEAAGLKVEIKTPAPFTATQPPASDFDFSAFQALPTLNQGGVSELIPSRGDGALLVHAIQKEEPAFDPASPDAVEMKRRMAPILAERNAEGVLAALVEAELAKSAPATE